MTDFSDGLDTADLHGRIDALAGPVAASHRWSELLAEVADLREALSTRRVMDQAIGVIRVRAGLSTEEALAELRGVSHAGFRTMAEAAQRVVDDAVRGAKEAQPEDEQDPRRRSGGVVAIIDSVSDHGIVEVDQTGIITYFSAGARSLYGYSEAEVLGRPVSILHSDPAAGERELFKALKFGRSEFEDWQVHRDGHRFRGGVVVKAIRDEAGAITGFAAAVRDLGADHERVHSMFRGLLESAPDAMVIVDSDGRIMLANAQTDWMFGYEREDLVGMDLEMLLPPRFRSNHRRYRTAFFSEPKFRRMGVGRELLAMRRGGAEFPVEVSLSPLRLEQGVVVSAAIRDITELKAARQAEARLAAVVQSSSDAIISMTADGVIQTSNPGTDLLLGLPAERIVGRPLHSLMPVGSQEMFDTALQQIRRGARADPYDTQWCRTDGTLVDVTVNVFGLRGTSGDLIGVSAIARDITAQVESQRQLERLAHFDTLTGLVNRAETIGRLEAALQTSRDPGPELGVLFCDIDYFKTVNDTWGHAVGDDVLSTLATRISGCLRHGDTVGRTGGDEMMVLLPGVHSLDEVAGIAEKIRIRAAEPIDAGGNTINVALSIGATLAVPGESVSIMTARSDRAMYQAKRSGRNRVTCL